MMNYYPFKDYPPNILRTEINPLPVDETNRLLKEFKAFAEKFKIEVLSVRGIKIVP